MATTVLNIDGVFSSELVTSFPTSDIYSELADVPSLDQIRIAMSLVQGIKLVALPCSDELLMYLFTSVWDRESMPQMLLWFLYLDLSCDNWRGISLIEVVGKVFAKIVQQRLQVIVGEEEVADSWCGFWVNRGCIDMIFCAHKLIEKIILKHFSCS